MRFGPHFRTAKLRAASQWFAMALCVAALMLFFAPRRAFGQTTTVVTATVKDVSGNVVPTGQVTFDLKPGIDTTISGNARFTPQTTVCIINEAQNGGTGTITSLVRASDVVTATFSSQTTFIAGDTLSLCSWSDATFNGYNAFTVTAVSSVAPWTVTWNQVGVDSSATGGSISALRANPNGPCTVTQNTALTPAGTYYKATFWPNFSPTSSINFYATTNTIDLASVVPTPATVPAFSFVDLFSNQTITGQKTFSNPADTFAGSVSNLLGPGSISGTFGGTAFMTGPWAFKNVNAVRFADQFPGATMDAQVAAAIADLPTNGGTVDARGYGATTQTWAANVAVGTTTKMVTLLLDRATKITPTISNGTSYMIDLGPGSAVIAPGDTQMQSNIGGIQMTSATNMGGIIRPVNQGVSGAGFEIRGLTIGCPSTPTITGAVINLTNALQIGSYADNNITCGLNGVLVELTQTSGAPLGPINLTNDTTDCAGFTGSCTPFLEQAVSGGGVMGMVDVIGGSWAHPGTTSNKIFDFEGITANSGNDCAGVLLSGVQIESSNLADIGVNLVNCTNVKIDGLLATAAAHPGAAVVQISGANSDGINITGVHNQGAWTNDIVNSTASPTETIPVTNANRFEYHYTAASKLNSYRWSGPTGVFLSVDSNGVAVPALTSGDCVQAGTGGKLSSTTSPCNTVIQSSARVTLASDIALTSGTPTTVLTNSRTMPSAGCPCRVIVSYGVYATTNNQTFSSWVSDATNIMASAQTTGTGTSTTGLGATEISPVTYANNAVVTFTLTIEDNGTGGTVKAAPVQGSGTNTWMSLSVLTSN